MTRKMLSQLAKDLYNAQHRILDHRAFLSGEIESFRYNFEAKRNDREVFLLFNCLSTSGEIKYLSNRLNLGKTHLDLISGEINNLLGDVEEFLTNFKQEKVTSDKLLQSRQQRAQKKEIFFKDLEHQLERVANSFEEKEEEIADLYSDLQIKLNIPK